MVVFILAAEAAASDTEMAIPSRRELLTRLLSVLVARCPQQEQPAILLTPVVSLVVEPVAVGTVAAAILVPAADKAAMAIKAAVAQVATLGMAVPEAAILPVTQALAAVAAVAAALTMLMAALAAAVALVFLAKEVMVVAVVTAPLAWALRLAVAAVPMAETAVAVLISERPAILVTCRLVVGVAHTAAARELGALVVLIGPQAVVAQFVLFGLAELVARRRSHRPMLEHKIWTSNSTFKSLTGIRRITL